MTRRELGAAVNIMWVIFLIVLLLGAGGYIYSVQSEIAKAKSNEARAIKARADMEEVVLRSKENHIALSKKVGFLDASAGEVNSSQDAIEGKIEQLRGQFPNDIGSEDRTLDIIIERVVAASEKHSSASREAAASFSAENQKRLESETAKDQIRTSMEGQLSQGASDLRDERDRASSQKSQDDDRIASLQDQLDEAAAQVRERQSEFDSKVADLEQSHARTSARVADLATKVKLLGVDDDPWAVDGTVVDVGASTGLVFIDLGGKHLLRSGVRFDVFRFGKGGEMIRKGSIEVRSVGKDSAMGGIVEELDDLDPIAAGDVIASPHYNRDRSKVFALLGNFPIYGRTFLANRLRALGAEVEPEVNSHCDFVVLGMESTEEDAPSLSELPGYQTAENLNIQMIRVRDLDSFLKP